MIAALIAFALLLAWVSGYASGYALLAWLVLCVLMIITKSDVGEGSVPR